ncbi:RagB/SusD family nutrient uptake outer membrane protein [Bacteroidota bacterium]
MIKKYLFILLILAFTICSCEDYLDREPQTQITESIFYKTDDDAVYAVNAAYEPLQQLWRRTMWYIGDLQSDDVLTGGDGPTDRPDATEIAFFDVHPDNREGVEQCWDNAYRGIYYSNIVLSKVPEIEMNSERLKYRILAEAKFLKAYYYFILVRVFGDVPLFPELIDAKDYKTVVRNKKEDVYAQIINDLTYATDYLYDYYEDDNIGRATKGAAYTVLAKVYLTLGMYIECIDACYKIENLGYELEINYQKLFNYERNENGIESIFEVQYRYNPSINPPGENSFISEYVSPRDQALYSIQSYGFFVPSAEFLNLWEEEDQRFKITLITPGDSLEKPDGTYYKQDSNVIWEAHGDKRINPTASNTRKYMNFEYGRSQSGHEKSSTNMYIFRYAEVLLMHAEAENELNGPTGIAHEYVNKIRRRAYKNDIHDLSGLSQSELREAIFIERRKEFFMEQKRWFDIQRRGPEKAEEILHNADKTNFNSEIHMILPVPQKEIDINKNITQNTGY